MLTVMLWPVLHPLEHPRHGGRGEELILVVAD